MSARVAGKCGADDHDDDCKGHAKEHSGDSPDGSRPSGEENNHGAEVELASYQPWFD